MAHVGEYGRAEPWVFGASLAGAAAYSVAVVGSTVAVGMLVDDVVIPLVDDRADSTRAAQVLVLVAALAVLRAAGVVGRRFFAAMFQARTKSGLQRRALDRLLVAPLRHVRTTPTGQLLAHVDSDADAATELLAPLPFAIGAVFLLVLSVVSLLAIDPWIGVVGLVLIPVLVLLQRFHGRFIEQPSLDVRVRLGEVASIAHESFDGALVVKTLGREADEQRRFVAATEDLQRARVEQVKVNSVFGEAVETLPNLGVIGLILVAAWRVDVGAITTGQLVQAVALFGLLSFPIMVTGYFFATAPLGTVARERLEDVFDLDVDPLLGDGAVDELPRGSLGVELSRVMVAADETVLVDDVSLTVAPGETVALVGPTGSGKSTVLRAMARLIEIESGHVRVGGVDLKFASEQSIRERIAVALQEPFMFGDTIDRNLRIGVAGEAVDDRVSGALETAAAGFTHTMPSGLDTVVGERGVTLSGGQRQRVALARALLRDPGLLLLDDATSAVDPTVEQRILERLRELDTTVVVVAHRLSTIALADRVAYVADGRIAAIGTHDELLARPDYALLVQAYEAGEDGR